MTNEELIELYYDNRITPELSKELERRLADDQTFFDAFMKEAVEREGIAESLTYHRAGRLKWLEKVLENEEE